MPFESLITIDSATTSVGKHSASAKPKKSKSTLGCDNCPSKQNWEHGVHPIMGQVRGKKIFVWAQSPGPQENKHKNPETGELEPKELVGPAGQFLWAELKKVGITRDMCDIQNVVRCFPADYQEIEWPPLRMRSPVKEEIKCCSIYTQQAVEKSKAKVHLVFGAIAHKALLGPEYKKDKKIFWSDRLQATVFCLTHPSFFLRAGYRGNGNVRVPIEKLKEFRTMLAEASDQLSIKGVPDKYAFIKKQHYVSVTPEIVGVANWEIRKYATKFRVTADIEYGIVDGKKVPLCYGFGLSPGKVYVFWLNDKLSRSMVRRLLADGNVRKVFHYGCSDVEETRELLGVGVKGYDYDTLYGEYFAFPDAKKYGLEAIAERRFPKFGPYKELVCPEAFTKEFLEKKKIIDISKIKPYRMGALYQEARNSSGLNYALVPRDKLALYNAADCDLTKRIEITTSKQVNPPLMRLYRDSAFVLQRMEREGPLFDYQHYQKLKTLYPIRLEALKAKLCKVTGTKDFNANSPKQVYDFVYNKLGLETNGKEDTRKDTLLSMLSQHESMQWLIDFKRDSKICSTYLEGFKLNADVNHGRLRTQWLLTGTRTGRLSSGGKGKRIAGDRSIIALQNIHGEDLLQCLLISDPRWREIYLFWKEYGPFTTDTDLSKFEDYYVFLGFDFAQMELRFLAWLSGDKEYKKMFMDPDNDPHSMVGHALTGWPIEKIKMDDRVRRTVKGFHFGIIYGLKEAGLVAHLAAKGVKTTLEEMARYRRRYFEKYRGVAKWLENQIARVAELGYAETIFGFRRPINVEEQKSDEYEGAFWENQAVNCVDFETEALTQRGWVPGFDIKRGDVLLTYNADRDLMEWQSAIDVKLFPDYKGPVCHLTSRSFSAVTTPNHRWILTSGDECTSAKFPRSVSIPRVRRYEGPAKSRYSDDFIRLVGWVLTDGSYGRRASGKKSDRMGNPTDLSGWAANSVYVCQSKPENVDRIDKLFRRLGVDYRTKAVKNRSDNDEVYWSFSGTYGRWFKGMFPHRIVTPEFLIQLPARQLKILFLTMMLGDGFLCRSKRGIDTYQMLAYLCGKASTVRYRDMSKYTPLSDKLGNVPRMTGVWGGKILRRKNISVDWIKNKSSVSAVGMWCPMVPNTFFVARRKGTVYITGNTPVQGGAHQMMLTSVAALERQKEKYDLLQHPQLEIHDYLGWRIKLKNLWKALLQGTELLEQEPVRVCKDDFGIDWDMPLKAEASAGFRFGVKVKDIGIKVKTTHEFLNAWCEKNRELQLKLQGELKKLG